MGVAVKSEEMYVEDEFTYLLVENCMRCIAHAIVEPAGELAHQAALVREVLGNPFRPVNFPRSWRTDTAVALASEMYASGDFSAMPILADARQDAGCDNPDVLDYCHGRGPHVRGCWVLDLVLGKSEPAGGGVG